MKGIVFNLLEECVTREYGADAWDTVLDSAGLNGVYTSLGTYPHGEFFGLVTAASAELGTPPRQVIRWFGRSAMPLLAEFYPELFQGHDSTRPFLLTLNDIIHPEVRKLYPGADCPEFDFDVSSPEVLRMGYRSERKLCAFGEGLIEGAADHYGEAVTIVRPQCLHRGDDKCVFEITLSHPAA